MPFFAKLPYFFELLLASFSIAYSFPKKNKFLIRLTLSSIIGFGIYTLMTYLFDLGMDSVSDPMAKQLFRFVGVIFSITIVLGILFIILDAKFIPVFSVGIGGVAIQQSGYFLFLLLDQVAEVPLNPTLLEFLVCFVLTIISFFILGRFVKKHRIYENYDKKLTFVSFLIVFICTFLIRFQRLGFVENKYNIVCIVCYAETCCLLSLFIQFFLYRFMDVKNEAILTKKIGEEKKKQYELSKDNIDLINIKCHDLKHIIRNNSISNDEIEDMKKIVTNYEKMIESGLDSLDVILNEKILLASKSDVLIQFMGNGKCLNFMNDMDIYSLFGNALDNAIEAAKKCNLKEERVVSIIIYEKGDLIHLSITNYTNEDIKIVGELPLTNKNYEIGYHGFGLKSIQLIAEKYSGRIKISYENKIFNLNIFMMKGNKAD